MTLALPGWANRANAAMAVAGAQVAGVDVPDALAAMRDVADVAGRYQVVDVDGVRARLLLAKNPAGWAEALDLIRPDVPVVVGINARVQDGRDPSWLWDVPFERLQGRFVVATGERGRDLAVRLRYAEVEHRFVEDELEALTVAAERGRSSERGGRGRGGGDGPVEVDVAANYSSFQDIRRRLERHAPAHA